MRRQMSVGRGVVLVDFFISYLLPALLLLLIGGNDYAYYIHTPPTLEFWVTLLLAGTGFVLISWALAPLRRALLNTRLRLEMWAPPVFAYRLFVWLFLAAAIVFSQQGLSRFRYDTASAADQLSIALALVVFGKVIVSFQTFYVMCAAPQGNFAMQRRHWLLVVLALALAADGSMSFMLLAIVAFVTLTPTLSGAMIYQNESPGGMRVKTVLLPALFGLVAACMWFAGETIKRGGFDAAYAAFTDTDRIEQLGFWLLDRISTLFFSANLTAERAYTDPGIREVPWSVIADSLHYRTCRVFGDWICLVSPERSDIVQVSHWNYFQITSGSPLTRAGASPGVVGSALYLFPFWVAPLFAAFYYYVIALLIDFGLAGNARRLTLIGLLLGMFLLRGVLLNPADMLIILSPPCVFFVLFVIISLLAHKYNQGRRMQFNLAVGRTTEPPISPDSRLPS